MAKPIKETPTLYGKDAKAFIQANSNVKKESKESIEKMKASFAALKSIAKFNV